MGSEAGTTMPASVAEATYYPSPPHPYMYCIHCISHTSTKGVDYAAGQEAWRRRKGERKGGRKRPAMNNMYGHPSHYILLITSMTGHSLIPRPFPHKEPGNEATTDPYCYRWNGEGSLLKWLASHLATKCDYSYSSTLPWLWCRLTFSVLQFAIQWIRTTGFRLHYLLTWSAQSQGPTSSHSLCICLTIFATFFRTLVEATFNLYDGWCCFSAPWVRD